MHPSSQVIVELIDRLLCLWQLRPYVFENVVKFLSNLLAAGHGVDERWRGRRRRELDQLEDTFDNIVR